MTTFERINNLSKKRGLSLRTLAKKAGLGETTIYGWKKKSPDASNLNAVADILGVTSDYLLGKNETPSWATKSDTIDLKKYLENSEGTFMYGGENLTEEEKEKLKIAMTQIFWDRHKHN